MKAIANSVHDTEPPDTSQWLLLKACSYFQERDSVQKSRQYTEVSGVWPLLGRSVNHTINDVKLGRTQRKAFTTGCSNGPWWMKPRSRVLEKLQVPNLAKRALKFDITWNVITVFTTTRHLIELDEGIWLTDTFLFFGLCPSYNFYWSTTFRNLTLFPSSGKESI